jgi:hypothetical protein
MAMYRRGFEVLLRKLLNYHTAPAVVILHWWSPVTQVCQCAGRQLLQFSRDAGLTSWRAIAQHT